VRPAFFVFVAWFLIGHLEMYDKRQFVVFVLERREIDKLKLVLP
jgi:hypothetical protein